MRQLLQAREGPLHQEEPERTSATAGRIGRQTLLCRDGGQVTFKLFGQKTQLQGATEDAG